MARLPRNRRARPLQLRRNRGFGGAANRNNDLVVTTRSSEPPRMLEFTIDRTRDSDGSKLRRLLQAQLTCVRMGAARSFLAHLLAMTGLVIWLETIWPDLLAPEIRFFVLAVFGGFLVLALGVVIEEIAWRVRLKRCLKADEGLKPLEAPGD
jgi:hypothetical protein